MRYIIIAILLSVGAGCALPKKSNNPFVTVPAAPTVVAPPTPPSPPPIEPAPTVVAPQPTPTPATPVTPPTVVTPVTEPVAPPPPIVVEQSPVALVAPTVTDTVVYPAFTLFKGHAPRFDYYVSPAGLDSNDGRAPVTSGKSGPWKTVGKSARTAGAGDIVHVTRGTYPEYVNVTVDGAQGSPVRFYADTGAVVSSFRLNSRKFIEIYGFTIIGAKQYPTNWRPMLAVVVDDPTVKIDPSENWSTRQAKVNKKYATFEQVVTSFTGPNYSAFTVGIWSTGSDHISISSNTISLHTIGIDSDGASSSMLITQNVVSNCESGIWSYGAGFSDSAVDSNHSFQNLNSGFTLWNSRNVTVTRNLSEFNGLHGFTTTNSSTNCKLIRNTAVHNGSYTETMPFPGSSAFNFYAQGPGNVADGNYAAYQLDPTGNDGNGFIADTSPNGVTFLNNVASHNAGRGIALTLTPGNILINNTLVDNCSGTVQSVGNGGGVAFSATGNTIINNIFYKNHGCGIHGDGTLKSQTVDFNLYDSSVPIIHDSYSKGSRVYSTPAAAFAATGSEAHGVLADPAFIVGSLFKPSPTSPAVGAADKTHTPPTDFNGAPRSAVRPVLGAVNN